MNIHVSSHAYLLLEIHFPSDVSLYSSHRKLDTLEIFEPFNREHFSFAHVFGLISERQKFSFTSFWVFVQVQKHIFTVTRLVRTISSFHCSSKEEKFCGFKHVEITSGRLNILAKRKCEYNIALFRIGSPIWKFHTAKNNLFLSALFSFRKLAAWGRLEKNNGGVIDVYFQNLLKFHQSDLFVGSVSYNAHLEKQV